MDVRPTLTRRQVLLGGAAGLLLVACGSDDNDESADDSTTTTTTPGAPGEGLTLFNLFPPQQPVKTDLRLPLALADHDGSFDVDLPDSVAVRLRRPDGGTTAPVTVPLHDVDLPRGYYPLRTAFDVTGRWTIVVEAGTSQVESTVDVRPASQLPAVPGPGDELPMIPTPTSEDNRGVNPICTRDPVCPFHERSLDEVIGGPNPIVLLVSTPAFCQVAICGPVLDLLVDRRATLEAEGLEVIHVEVYVDNRARQTAPAVNALGLTFEPALFLAAPDGTVTDRFDSIYDSTELDEALARLVP